jgi:probable HAF family extracellular repeat protein
MLLATAASTRADDFQGLGLLPGATGFSQAFGVSSDGSVAVGESSTSGAPVEAVRWTSSGVTGLGWLPGGSNSFANGVNSDGSVVVGISDAPGHPNFEAFRWTATGGMVALGFLPGGTISSANAVNSDGTVVVGHSDSAATGIGANFQAFRWTLTGGMVSLGVLPGGTSSDALAVNADGTVVVGNSTSAAFSVTSGCFLCGEAFRWTQTGGMVGLGVLPGGSYSTATGVSADGSVVVGSGTYNPGSGLLQAFRWTQTGGMVGLGFLTGGTNSAATAVNANGSIVVGYSSSTSVPGGEAFRWTAATGIQSVKGLLTGNGVNLAGWVLEQATGISGNGAVIVGYGTNPSGQTEAWIARSTTSFGFITPSIVAQSFAGQAAIGQTGNAAISGTLGNLNEYATQAKLDQGSRNTPYQVFGYASYDSDPVSSGVLGMTVDLSRDIFVGASAGANALKTDMVFNGSADMSGASAGAFIARSPIAGLQWLAGIAGTAIQGDVTRGYLNGNDFVSSRGSTSGRGVGATGRLGWVFNPIPVMQLTPFASYTVTSTGFDGYAESGGPFPAKFAAFTSTAQTARLGSDARYTFAPGKWLWGTVAWAHRVDGGNNPDISGTLIGLFSMTAPGIASATDWAELTGGVRLPVWNNGAVTASLTASVTPHQNSTYVSRLGITQAF